MAQIAVWELRISTHECALIKTGLVLATGSTRRGKKVCTGPSYTPNCTTAPPPGPSQVSKNGSNAWMLFVTENNNKQRNSACRKKKPKTTKVPNMRRRKRRKKEKEMRKNMYVYIIPL